VAELTAWAQEETGGGLTFCQDCQPDQEERARAEHPAEHTLTKFGSNVLSYVVDLAVIYLDGEDTNFCPTVEAIAEYLGKTPAQIAPAIHRLIEENYLVCDLPAAGTTLTNAAVIYPTAAALRLVPAFGRASEEDLQAELAKLRSG
jgi:hypothetical protein